MSKDGRSRNWLCVVYPESAPENWRDILDEYHFAWIESPLHDKDINPTGEVKKPHYHVLLSFEGKKSVDQIKEILQPLNCSLPIVCQSLRGSVRYFCHMDNPEKYQYSPDQIIGHGGADVLEALKPTLSSRYGCISEMMAFCREKHVTEFYQLCDYAYSERYDDWFPLLADSAGYVMGQYIKSLRHCINGYTKTGEREYFGG